VIIIRIGNLTLVDFEVVWLESGRRHPATIRKYCKPWGKHRATGRLLYNGDEAKAILAEIKARPPRQRKAKVDKIG